MDNKLIDEIARKWTPTSFETSIKLAITEYAQRSAGQGAGEHSRSCAYWSTADNDCTCCLQERIHAQTAETISAAWRKRATEAETELTAAKAVIAQHDLCHNLHGKVDAVSFAEGCATEQRKLYGCAPHADALAASNAKLAEVEQVAWTTSIALYARKGESNGTK